MNDKKEINIIEVAHSLRVFLDVYRDMINGRLPASEEDKVNVGKTIKNFCSNICEYVDLN